ncbi:MAG: hypothetical protein CXZ00_07435 [Acidobacteria bacterium]|nr:MAG: hypothetical protein CXZ00_07435 [Acidobacteriota bacterium]
MVFDEVFSVHEIAQMMNRPQGEIHRGVQRAPKNLISSCTGFETKASLIVFPLEQQSRNKRVIFGRPACSQNANLRSDA